MSSNTLPLHYALPVYGQSGPQVALPNTLDDRIDGQADRVESSRLASIYRFKIQRIVVQQVKLEYLWPAAMRGDVLDTGGSHGGQGITHACSGGLHCHSALAIFMEKQIGRASCRERVCQSV